MESSSDRLFKLGAFLVIGLVVGVGGLVVSNRQAKVVKEAVAFVDVAEELAGLHKRAANGTLALTGPATVEMSLIQAGFPPKRPVPTLLPRARLEGGAAVKVGTHTVSLGHFSTEDARMSIFLLPRFQEAIPSTAARIQRGQIEMHMAERGDVTIMFWRRGHWVTAVATEAAPNERNALVDIVWTNETQL
jgi:hypothetical protein